MVVFSCYRDGFVCCLSVDIVLQWRISIALKLAIKAAPTAPFKRQWKCFLEVAHPYLLQLIEDRQHAYAG